MTRHRAVALLFFTFTLSATGAAQVPAPKPTPPATTAEAHARLWANSLKRWQTLGAKVVTMARRFPQEKANFRFHADTRTFLEEVWHETYDSQVLEARLKGPDAVKAMDPKLFTGEGRPRNLGLAAGELEAVLASALRMLEADPPLGVVGSLDFYIEHLGVTYGKLAAMYRANNLVPPVTADKRK